MFIILNFLEEWFYEDMRAFDTSYSPILIH
jgi:hypothetical protein